MDDMLIATPDNLTLHTKYVHRILDKLEKHDLYLKPEKCSFTQRRMEFLGVVLENNTIQMDPTKVKGVADWPLREPHRHQVVLRFHRILPVLHPELLARRPTTAGFNKESNPLGVDSRSNKGVRNAKMAHVFEARTNSTPIQQTIHSSHGRIGIWRGRHTLTSGRNQPQNPLKPRLHPIAYYSATFTPTERNYDIYERELLAVIKALQNWRPHLLHTTHPFTLITDHANLTFWKHPRKVNRRVARWFAELQTMTSKSNTPRERHTQPPTSSPDHSQMTKANKTTKTS